MWSPISKKNFFGIEDETLSPFFHPFTGSHLGQMFNLFFSTRSRGSWIPAVDISEQDDGYTLVADLPEVKKEDVRVYTESANVVCMSGNRKRITKPADNQMLFAERGFGHFERCFELPTPVDTKNVKATFSEYKLNVTIPKLRNSDSRASSPIPID
ncbi:hypothetical protein JKF63_00430 [Porcisia hertigi]|uniref:SHSP domain-containing protein n=1 Tax=Porcisia hertigi TaxID=2761500 RepID=A0A836L122_9TRYP|nr:hypothetical protein JKF63_00430 [Porcisia hertigi]